MDEPQPASGWTRRAALRTAGAAVPAVVGAGGAPAPPVVAQAATWTQRRKLTRDGAAPSDRFGQAVALDGDRAFVGAPFADAGAENAGAVSVLERDGAAWTRAAELRSPDPAVNDRFGFSVAVDGDRAAVGAPGDSTRDPEAGAAYVFERSAEWTRAATLDPGTANADQHFGDAVALEDDRAVVGAPDDSTRAEFAGAAYAFSADDWTRTRTLLAPDGEAERLDHFGRAVALDGGRAVVGVPQRGPGEYGVAYVFAFPEGDGPVRLDPPSPATLGYLGGRSPSTATGR